MSEITQRLRAVTDRLSKRRPESRTGREERALKRNAAKAQRLNHERLDNKFPR